MQHNKLLDDMQKIATCKECGGILHLGNRGQWFHYGRPPYKRCKLRWNAVAQENTI